MADTNQYFKLLEASLASPSAFLPELTAFALSSLQLESLAQYAELLERWSTRVDLIAPCPPEFLVSRHLLDSLVAAKVIEQLSSGEVPQLLSSPSTKPPSSSILDLGSGAGLPGVVLAVALPMFHVKLFEPREKRTLFLGEVVRILGLKNCKVVRSRVDYLISLPVEERGTRREPTRQEPEGLSGASSHRAGYLITRATSERDFSLSAATQALMEPGGFVVEQVTPGAAPRLAFKSFQYSYKLPPDGACRVINVSRETF